MQVNKQARAGGRKKLKKKRLCWKTRAGQKRASCSGVPCKAVCSPIQSDIFAYTVVLSLGQGTGPSNKAIIVRDIWKPAFGYEYLSCGEPTVVELHVGPAVVNREKHANSHIPSAWSQGRSHGIVAHGATPHVQSPE